MKINSPSCTTARLIALCATCFLIPAMACPSECACKWKNGKRHVECIQQELKQIPDQLDPETQVLDFTGNEVHVLQKEIFEKLRLLNLQKIYLSFCKIHKVDNLAFKGLANLIELDLSNNYLTIIPSPNFIHIPSLMRLTLSSNLITEIKTRSFQHLSYLNTLELNDNQISKTEVDAFAGLNHLEWLRIKGNRLTNIQGEIIFPITLKGVDLEENAWNCDCNMKDLHSWLSKTNMSFAIDPVCSTPERLHKRKIKIVDESQLACLPIITPTLVYVESKEGSNVTLQCITRAIPAPHITWFYRGYPIDDKLMHHISLRRYTTPSESRSELLIFNTGTDDNGTYTCQASNVAGFVVANYTVKIIAKEQPVIVEVSFSQKYLVFIVTGVFLVFILLIIIIAVVLLKYKTDTKTNKKHESRKEVALRTQNLSSTRNNTNNFDTMQRKFNGNILTNAQTHHVVQYTGQENIKTYVDRNPDLVNDTESIVNNMLNENSIVSVYQTQPSLSPNADHETAYSLSTIPRQVTWQDQQNGLHFVGNMPPNKMYNIYQHSADIHLNPGCFLDTDGYPYDFGLPKVGCRPAMSSNYAVINTGYQTLPHKKLNGQKVSCKFAKDTEFNSTPCYSFVKPSFRRTPEGYPIIENRTLPVVSNGNVYLPDPSMIPSPPEGYKTEPLDGCCGISNSDPCTSRGIIKGTCAVMVPINVSDLGQNKCYHVETRCVDTQTPDIRQQGEMSDMKSTVKCSAVNPLEVCTESPDEGYVGEVIDPSDP